MYYQIALNVVTDLRHAEMASLLQEAFDQNGVAGAFLIKDTEDGCSLLFDRNAAEDKDFILGLIPPAVEINDKELATAAGEQLRKELVEYDINPRLNVIVDALSQGRFVVKNMELLRPSGGSDSAAFDRYCAIIQNQGWAEDVQIHHLEGFISEHPGMLSRLADYMERMKTEENNMTVK